MFVWGGHLAGHLGGHMAIFHVCSGGHLAGHCACASYIYVQFMVNIGPACGV